MTDNDKLAFLDEEARTETVAPKPEPAVVETASPPPAAQDAPPASPITPPTPTQPEPGYVPIAALMDERDKRQAFERKLAELEATKTAPTPIDPLTDPEGFARDFESKVEKAKQDILFDTTHRFAVRQHGADVVKAAEVALGEECKTNPAFFQTVMRQPDPYEFVVKWHKRQVAIAKLGDDDPDTWLEKQIKEKGYVLPQRDANGQFIAAAPAPATPTPTPKPSLASAPAASGSAPKTPTGDGVAFNAAFRD